jgi:hypothetical protein
MIAILKNVLTALPENRSNKEIIRWWEQRRVFYNVVMLVAGCCTILLALILKEIVANDLFNVIPPVLVFALSANLFYTLGWVVEIACKKYMQDKEIIQRAGPVLFIAGVSFSILFTIAIDIAILVAFFFGN